MDMDNHLSTEMKKKILIVDDNPINLRILADYLEAFEYRVLVARDGRSGIEKAQYAQPDIILLDVMMPDIDGFETCRFLKADETTRAIPVIFMTALSETESKVEGFEAGAVDYVTKPLQQREVLARIRTHLQLRELTENLEQLVKQRTNELETAYRHLSRLDKAKSDFISIMSHELRTPLAVIDGYTQLLQDNTAVTSDEEAQFLVGNILTGTQRMLRTMNDIFDVTRIDNDFLRPYREPLVMQDVLDEVYIKVTPALQKRKLRLTRIGIESLPRIQADKVLLPKLFYHLIVNAIKYTPDGGQIRVVGQFRELSDLPAPIVEILVEDNGIGIEPQHLELIFEKFYQTGQVNFHSSGTSTFKGGGPGLGLAIARGIVQGHGGRIWAESEGYDEAAYPGSRFFVWLPVDSPSG